MTTEAKKPEAQSPVRLEKVVVLGANGAMGAGTAAMFASGGCEVTLVARDIAKAEASLGTIQGIAKSETIINNCKVGTYDQMPELLKDADLIFECVAEEMALKRDILAKIDAARPENALVATVSSGLSIAGMTEGTSEGLRQRFAGIHLYNPVHMMTGTELIPHPSMDPALAGEISRIMTERFGRQMITCADQPAFAGNRIGFKVLNEIAQLAEEHGVQRMDTLIGPYTGRALPPLSTIDLVGWDVHQAIVDNVYENTNDEAHEAFKMPAYMLKVMHRGHLGDKTPELGGFYRRVNNDGRMTVEALDPKTGNYAPIDRSYKVAFVEEVKDLHHRGRYREGINRFMEAEGADADIARKVILGYVAYALNRVGPSEVVQDYADVDRIMSAGFNWAPPSALVDYIGLDRTLSLLERYNLPVPAVLQAAKRGEIKTPLFNLPFVSAGRYFGG